MKSKFKKFTVSVLLVALVISNSSFQKTVFASECNNCISEIVYVDGNAIKVSVDTEQGKIISESVDRKEDSILEISCNGDSIVTVYDKQEEEYKEYELDISNMSDDDIDITVLDNDDIVEEYDEMEDLIENTYEGQMAISVVTGISIATLITAVLKVAACIAVAGVIYYGGKAAVNAIKQSSQKQKYYYKAYIYDKNVFIAINSRISKVSAVNRLKSGLSIYTYTSKLAKSAVKATGLGCTKKEISDLKGKIRFWHYHTAKRRGEHAFYGLPKIY